jgi:hypothetical protein
MKIKKPILYMIAIAIVGLLITSASSLPIKQASSSDDEIGAEYLTIKCQPLAITKINNNPVNPSFSGVPITGGDYDEFHPSVAGAPAGGFYAMVEQTEDGSDRQIYLYGSTDGTVWDPILYTTAFNNAQYTDMDQNVYGTYGTCGAPPDLATSGQIMILQGEIEDGWVWDWYDNGFDSFVNNHIACYTCEGPAGDPGTWNWGGVTLTGYNNYNGADIVDCPFIFYQTSSDGYATIGWLTGSVSGCKHTGSAMDLAKNYLYSVYDRNTGTSWELLIRKDNFGAWQPSGSSYRHPYMTAYHVTDALNLTYPSVAAYNDNVIVACQKGNDIVVYYSTNGFASKTEVPIQTGASYPEVVMAAKGIGFITYIKDNTLYYRTSDDGGATWSDEEIVSDSQVNLNYRAANLDESGGSIYGAWEDTRGANIDAYFDKIYEYINHAPDTPTIDGLLKVGVGVQAFYTFSTTDPDGDDVYYYVDWGDGSNTGWITQTSANHTWANKGKYAITCKAKDEFNLESGVATLQIQVPRSKSVNNFLYQLFERFPNAFPLLRIIFGY